MEPTHFFVPYTGQKTKGKKWQTCHIPLLPIYKMKTFHRAQALTPASIKICIYFFKGIWQFEFPREDTSKSIAREAITYPKNIGGLWICHTHGPIQLCW